MYSEHIKNVIIIIIIIKINLVIILFYPIFINNIYFSFMSIFQIFQNPLYMSILLYIFIVIVIIYTKPLMFFDSTGKMKETGCGDNKVIFSLPMVLVISSIFIYFIIKILTN